MLRRIFRANQMPREGWVRSALSTLRLTPSTSRCQRLSDYRHDATLGDHLDLVLTVKHQQQRALNRIMRNRLRDGQSMKVLGGRAPRSYRDGLLVQCALRNGIVQSMGLREPFGLDQSGQRLAVAAGNEVRIYDAQAQIAHVYRNPWFAQLHSLYFSEDGTRLLTVSTGFDTVLEFDIARCCLTWAWNAWDHGYDVTPAGTRIRRGPASTRSATGNVITVDDPAEWNGFGLPTGLTAVHLNNARHCHYGEGQVFVTLFHHGRAVMVDRATGASREVLGGLLNPHGFEPGWEDEYMVTDTRRGQVIFFDERLEVKSVLMIDACAPVHSRHGLGEWLQNVLHLDRGLYAAVDMHRSCIWLFETASRRYRKVEVSHDWAVQNVIAVDPQRIRELDRRLDDYPEVHHTVADPDGRMAVAPGPVRSRPVWYRRH